MRTKRVRLRSATIMVGDVLVLNEVYDPNQYWLPFARNVIHPAPKKTRQVKHRPGETKHMQKEQWARLDDDCVVMYAYERGIPQYVLPFREYLDVSDDLTVYYADYPHWDRDEDGAVYRVSAQTASTRDAIMAWARENCRFQYENRYQFVRFASGDEAVIAKMVAHG